MSDREPDDDDDHDVPEGSALADHPLTARRLEKAAALRASGVDPYPIAIDRSHSSSGLRDQFDGLEPGTETGTSVEVAGRLMNIRRLGKLVFAVLKDIDGDIQLFVDRRVLGEEAFATFEDLDTGDWVWAAGEVITTKRGELSVRIDDYRMLSKALRPLPEKWHGLQDTERRYRQRYLDLLVNDQARHVALVRAKVVSEVRRQFEAHGFIEVETPVLQTLAGGAMARPFVTHHNALDIDMYLRIATELHLKRLLVGGLERVFELGRIFRNEGVDSTHNPEFTTVEAYQALADYNDIMELVETVVAAVAEAATGSLTVEYGGHEVDLAPPYRRVPMLDLVEEAVGTRMTTDMERADAVAIADRHGVAVDDAWGVGKIIAEVFEELVEDTIVQPTFVIDHPVEISPLARTHRSEPGLVERFELYIVGREYCDAFTELNDPLDQRARFDAQAAARAAGDDEAHPIDEDFIRALEHGMPPAGGLGLGIDRLVMLLTDSASIREVVLFPHLRPE